MAQWPDKPLLGRPYGTLFVKFSGIFGRGGGVRPAPATEKTEFINKRARPRQRGSERRKGKLDPTEVRAAFSTFGSKISSETVPTLINLIEKKITKLFVSCVVYITSLYYTQLDVDLDFGSIVKLRWHS